MLFRLIPIINVLNNLAIFEVSGEENQHICQNKLCYPKDYNRQELPGSHVKVYLTTIGSSTKLKKVDDENMILTYQPSTLIVWQDPRLTVTDVNNLTMMPDLTKDKIWFPKITITDRVLDSKESKFAYLGKRNFVRTFPSLLKISLISDIVAGNSSSFEGKFNVKFDQKTNAFIMVILEEFWMIWCEMDFSSFPLDVHVSIQTFKLSNHCGQQFISLDLPL